MTICALTSATFAVRFWLVAFAMFSVCDVKSGNLKYRKFSIMLTKSFYEITGLYWPSPKCITVKQKVSEYDQQYRKPKHGTMRYQIFRYIWPMKAQARLNI